MSFAVTALVADIKGGNTGFGQIVNDFATVAGDLSIITGGVAGFVPGGQGIAEIADIAGGATAAIAIAAHVPQLSSVLGQNISAAKNSASRQVIGQSVGQVNNSIQPINNVGQAFGGPPSIGSGPSSGQLPGQPGQIGDQNGNAPGQVGDQNNNAPDQIDNGISVFITGTMAFNDYGLANSTNCTVGNINVFNPNAREDNPITPVGNAPGIEGDGSAPGSGNNSGTPVNVLPAIEVTPGDQSSAQTPGNSSFLNANAMMLDGNVPVDFARSTRNCSGSRFL